MKNVKYFMINIKFKIAGYTQYKFLHFYVHLEMTMDYIKTITHANAHLLKRIQSNFNGSNTFGTMKISSRQRYLELMSVNHSARSGGILRIYFRFSLTGRLIVGSH